MASTAPDEFFDAVTDSDEESLYLKGMSELVRMNAANRSRAAKG